MENENKPNYITTAKGMGGWFAVQLEWCTEQGGYWDVHNTGIGRYAHKESAIQEGKEWAEAEGLEFKE